MDEDDLDHISIDDEIDGGLALAEELGADAGSHATPTKKATRTPAPKGTDMPAISDYVHRVGAAIPDIEDSWAWDGVPEDLPDDVIEISDAAIALSVWLDQTEPGHQGVITLPDGQMLAWHETEGWTIWDQHGISAPLGVATDATPEQVRRAAQRH